MGSTLFVEEVVDFGNDGTDTLYPAKLIKILIYLLKLILIEYSNYI